MRIMLTGPDGGQFEFFKFTKPGELIALRDKANTAKLTPAAASDTSLQKVNDMLKTLAEFAQSELNGFD